MISRNHLSLTSLASTTLPSRLSPFKQATLSRLSTRHHITSHLCICPVYRSRMMQLFADTCDIPVILPKSHSEAVVLGVTMLGRITVEGVKGGEDT
ncbi:hypothetical protein BDR07DRAFT_1411947 [Suillus spraguei]|nr:hypothetical protein BDR07DRAFT_1411947 [Suillus spraguei]